MRVRAGRPDSLPLAGVRVLDLTADRGEMCGRLLADLGADVLLVEPPAGSASRRAEPAAAGISLQFTVHNANKRSLVLDWRQAAGRDRLLGLVRSAHILIESERPGTLTAAGLSVPELHQANPRLVVTSITAFGQTGPYRDWLGTDWVHLALSSVLSRSGLPGEPPLMPPGRLADETASVQAAWATLVAFWSALQTGAGDHVDVSVLEAALETLDAPYGPAGSATGGVRPTDLPPGRPDARHMYPIFACADGYVRICVLARRQWRSMFAWLGEPAEFADPKYDLIGNRFAAAPALHELIGKLFRDQTREEVVAAGQRLGVPTAPVQNPAEVLQSRHLQERGAWLDVTLPGGAAGRMPSGFLEVDGVRAGIRDPAPELDGAAGFREAAPGTATDAGPAGPADHRGILAGLRVLDLGVIVVGADTGRLFADEGADVIKIESRAFPDGSRQVTTGDPISPSFVWGHRNKRSLGLDLRSAEGRELFLSLAKASDIVLSNFKPGTLESLGLGYDVLREASPGIVVVDSSALGRTGPDSRSMGYGPLVRATTGLTALWRYPDQPGGFCDSVTVYPDHTAARIGAVGALAKLISRRRDGEGGTVSVAQAEVMLSQFGTDFLGESIAPGSMTARGNTSQHQAPCGVYPCAGDDQWCVITVRNDDDWARLCTAIGAPDLARDPKLQETAGRLADRARIEARLVSWTSSRAADDVMGQLQYAGVPAGAMRRIGDLRADAQLRSRRFFTALTQPQLGDLPTVNGPAVYGRRAGPLTGPAPMQGQHTNAVVSEVLAMTDEQASQLAAAGILQPEEATS